MRDERHSKDIFERTLTLLEWPELCSHVSRFAVSDRGVRLCRALLPEISDALVRRQMSLTSEMVDLLARTQDIPLEAFVDLTPLLEKADRGERLSGEGLYQIGSFLRVVHRICLFFRKRREKIPSLLELSSSLHDLSALMDTLISSIDPDGQIKEQASPELRRLKAETRRCKREIIERIEAFLNDREASRRLQDRYYTIREGRFVLPFRADARGPDDGIVHDVSSSGATHFMEPQWLIGMNNAFRVSEIETKKEMDRILDDLTQRVASTAEAIRQDLEVVTQLDVVHAKARFARTIQGSEPGPSETGELVLRGLQHPLLTLRQISVVPNDLFLEPDERILVISGPNAGGKTVLLKAVGLAILMERTGLHIPAVPGSSIPPFDGIYADIGDQQDILRDVSTFSGHIEHVREILGMANDRSLVILDELAGSTDPQEGTSLALAILEDLYERGACVLVSTHYPAIKAWAQGHPHVRNAAMEFDWTRMEPTYKLRAGVPGQSSALEIARRIGLPEGLMERAKMYLQGQQTDLDYLLQELQEQRSALEEDKRQVSILRKRLQEEMSEREELNRSLRQERDDFVRTKKRRLGTEIKEARQRIREIMKTIAKARTPADVKRARENIRILEDEMRPAPLPICDPPRPLGQVGPGDPVEIVPLGRRGILLDDPKEKHGRLRVKVGSMEIHVDQHALGGVGPEETSSEEPQQTTSIRAPKAVQTSSQIDLRGMKVEDAMETIERYMDQTLMSQRDEVRIIHGHGTGALKKAVREWLSNCAFVEGYRPGDRFEGGDGATIVRLRNQYNHT